MARLIAVREILEDRIPVGALELGGWIKTHRQSKRVSFIELSDGTSVGNLQLVIDPNLAGYQEVAAKLSTGASIRVSGQLICFIVIRNYYLIYQLTN